MQIGHAEEVHFPPSGGAVAPAGPQPGIASWMRFSYVKRVPADAAVSDPLPQSLGELAPASGAGPLTAGCQHRRKLRSGHQFRLQSARPILAGRSQAQGQGIWRRQQSATHYCPTHTCRAQRTPQQRILHGTHSRSVLNFFPGIVPPLAAGAGDSSSVAVDPFHHRWHAIILLGKGPGVDRLGCAGRTETHGQQTRRWYRR